ncbi:hypothetical protein TIFTF001_023376 [Ficus carica]|uniref:Uncharacterized protein n=1 Tax=Ficus carica TaxID=3494 RepID=A0AA88AWS4_FICCA|nr:hypothetical protein TIFTF001_023376 [Ficus carica]
MAQGRQLTIIKGAGTTTVEDARHTNTNPQSSRAQGKQPSKMQGTRIAIVNHRRRKDDNCWEC